MVNLITQIEKEPTVIKVAAATIGIGILFLGTRGCNMAFNNRQINKPSCNIVSRATGLMGHVEYVKYKDGSADVKIYPNIWGHRYASSKFYQDLNGDGKIDRVRINGPKWQFHKLKLAATRDDYEANKKQFDYADRLLQELKRKYPK